MRVQMAISERTLKKMAQAIRKAIEDSLDDEDLGEAALRAFADNASLDDRDSLWASTFAKSLSVKAKRGKEEA